MPAEFFSPTGLDDAVALMASGNARPIAGGTDIFPAQGRDPFRHDLIDVTRIAGFRGISETAEGFRIGAATTWSDIAHADLPPALAGLQAAAREVGGVQIQNSGTVAGNLCNASPAADGVPPLLTLNAVLEFAGASGSRVVPLDAFITGPRQTTRGEGELVTAVLIPRPPSHARSAFLKLGSRRYLVISITMTAVVLGLDETGRIDVARVAVGACSPVAQRLRTLEKDMLGQEPGEVRVTDSHLAPLAPISDVRADEVYRLEAVAEQISRAISSAAVVDG